jgi:putative hydrolase of the HAD superfamily
MSSTNITSTTINTASNVLLFDLDGTLYDLSCGYENEIHSNIFKFMAESTGGKFDEIATVEDAELAWQPIFEKYNLTKRGLLGEGYVFDSLAYDTFVRRGASKYISQDHQLRVFLESLPGRKVIFTNAPESSANEILGLLGVVDQFEAVLGTEFMQNTVCKPERKAFEMVLTHLGIEPCDYHRVVYFEDSFKNLLVGADLGFKTVFIKSATLINEGRTEEELSRFDSVLERKVGMSLRKQMPNLWETQLDDAEDQNLPN